MITLSNRIHTVGWSPPTSYFEVHVRLYVDQELQARATCLAVGGAAAHLLWLLAVADFWLSVGCLHSLSVEPPLLQAERAVAAPN